MPHVKFAGCGIALLVVLAAGVPGRGAAARVQTPVAGTLSVDSRSMQPGELVVINATLPEDVADVRVTGLDRGAKAYRVDDTRWQALLGIDLDTEAGEKVVRLEGRRGVEPFSMETRITVLPKEFATRRLKVSPDFVNPPKAVQERIERESKLLQTVLGESADERLWDTPFVRPVPHRANSRFGTRSVFNGEPRNPHSGTDFLSPAGTPVRAPAAGRVVLAQALYFSGRTVIIDHGLDVFSQLLHLSRIDVKAGNTVSAGTVIGLVGATGRVTGAHLHWSLRVGGARVDPLAALELLGDAPSR
jgi:murein DD-endopeptidase MepM/ murein hydrolase activator NlpD